MRDSVIATNRLHSVSDPQRFARILQTRRRELGMSQADVRAAGGPSDLTLRKLEHGETDRPDFVTLSKLDTVLLWSPGSAGRAFEGGSPTPLDPESTAHAEVGDGVLADRPAKSITGLDHGVLLRTDALAELTRRGRALDELSELPESQAQAINELRYTIDRITRAWIIRQAEVARRDDTLAELIIVLDDHLRANPVRGTDDDAQDLKYLRWLAGYEQACSTEEEKVFLQRYKAAV